MEVKVDNASLCSAASSIILNSEAAAFHEKRLKESADLLEPLVRERLEVATFNSAVDYIKALRIRTVLMEEMRRVFQDMRRVDASSRQRRTQAGRRNRRYRRPFRSAAIAAP